MKAYPRVLFSGQKRILAAVALTTVAATVLVCLFLWDMLRINALEEARTSLNRLGAALAGRFTAEIEHRMRLLELLSRTDTFSRFPAKELIDQQIKGIPETVEPEKRRMAASLSGLDGEFSSLYVWLQDGRPYLVEPFLTQTRLHRFNYSDRPYFAETTRTGRPSVSDGFVTSADIPAVVINVPVFDDQNQILAHLGGVFFLSKLSSILERECLGEFGQGFLVDSRGLLIAHSSPERLRGEELKKAADHPLLLPAGTDSTEGLQRGGGKVFTDPSDGRSYLGVAIPLQWGWRLVLYTSMGDIEKQIQRRLMDVSGLVVLVLLITGSLGLAIVWWIGRRWVRADEELARARDELESRVEKRTEELSRLNDNLVLEIAERRKMEHRLREMATTDDLTGLLNRRGFFALVEHQLRIAQRSGKEMLLCYADLDGLKLINDTLGHGEGDQAIADAAEVLRQTFRQSDVLARIGGDEFVILVTDPVQGSEEGISARLQEHVMAHNLNRSRRYVLSLSLGLLRCDPRQPLGIDDLLAQADRWMYRQKQARKMGAESSEPGRHGDSSTGWLF